MQQCLILNRHLSTEQVASSSSSRQHTTHDLSRRHGQASDMESAPTSRLLAHIYVCASSKCSLEHNELSIINVELPLPWLRPLLLHVERLERESFKFNPKLQARCWPPIPPMPALHVSAMRFEGLVWAKMPCNLEWYMRWQRELVRFTIDS